MSITCKLKKQNYSITPSSGISHMIDFFVYSAIVTTSCCLLFSICFFACYHSDTRPPSCLALDCAVEYSCYIFCLLLDLSLDHTQCLATSCVCRVFLLFCLNICFLHVHLGLLETPKPAIAWLDSVNSDCILIVRITPIWIDNLKYYNDMIGVLG